MTDLKSLVRTITEQKPALLPGQSLEIKFKPIEGDVEIWAQRVPAIEPFPTFSAPIGSGPKIKLEDILTGEFDPGDISLPPTTLLGGIRIELFRPKGRRPFKTLETEDITLPLQAGQPGVEGNTLSFKISKNFAQKTWRCRFTNISGEKSDCRGHVRFAERVVALNSTKISTRLVNYALREFIFGLGFQVFAHNGIALIRVNREIEHLTDGVIKNARISFPSNPLIETENVKLNQISVEANRDSEFGQPRFVIKASFSGELTVLKSFEVRGLDIQINIIMKSSSPLADTVGNVIIPRITIGVKVDADALEGRIENAVKSYIEEFFLETEVRAALQRYLTTGFIQLAERNQNFWDISADDKNFIVRHFRLPRPGEPDFPSPPEEAELPGISHSIANFEPPSINVGTASATASFSAANIFELGTPAESNPSVGNLRKIEHIVVLMMENRSFDHMLGYLKVRGGRNDIDGLTGAESNPSPGVIDSQGNPAVVTVRELQNSLFKFSPHHDHQNVLKQVADGNMSGFLENFMARFDRVDPQFGMAYYTEERLPVYDFLARSFVVCDRWFCSHPGPTMPNRLCTLTGQTPTLDNLSPSDPKIGYLRLPTIFDFLTSAGHSWAYYYQDVAFLRLFDNYRLDDKNVLPLKRKASGDRAYSDDEIFFTRAASGKLPAVTFIDPNFADVPPISSANDDHPPADVKNGQELIRQIYNALVSSPQWEKTLFIITYDEHGGFYDHVSPPGTRFSPGGESSIPQVNENGPAFYGVRVPTFVISPWVSAEASHILFDHTSIMKTILLKFGKGIIPSVFGERVRQANHLGSLLARVTPRREIVRIDSREFPQASQIGEHEIEAVLNDYHDVIQSFAIPKIP